MKKFYGVYMWNTSIHNLFSKEIILWRGKKSCRIFFFRMKSYPRSVAPTKYVQEAKVKYTKHVPESIAQRRVAYESGEKNGPCLRRRVSKEPASVFKILV